MRPFQSRQLQHQLLKSTKEPSQEEIIIQSECFRKMLKMLPHDEHFGAGCKTQFTQINQNQVVELMNYLSNKSPLISHCFGRVQVKELSKRPIQNNAHPYVSQNCTLFYCLHLQKRIKIFLLSLVRQRTLVHPTEKLITLLSKE